MAICIARHCSLDCDTGQGQGNLERKRSCTTVGAGCAEDGDLGEGCT